MTNMKNTKRALVLSTMALFLCFAMLLGTTYAWFTDSVTSSGNIIKTGTLDVKLEYKTPTDTDWKDASNGAIFQYSNWEPGYTEIRNVKISNVGSLAFKFVLTIVPNVKVETETDTDGNEYKVDVDLADVIEAYMFPAGTTVTRDMLVITSDYYVGTVADLMADKDGAAYGKLEKGTNVEYVIVLKMSEEAGNEYQGLSLGGGFSINVLATQDTVESDDIDTGYDAEASLPKVGSATASVNNADPMSGKIEIKVANANTTNHSPSGMYIATVTVNKTSVADDVEDIKVTIVEDVPDNRIVVDAGETVKTYDITVTGLKENNTELVDVELYIGEGLNIAHFYHNETEIFDYVYNAGTNGKIKFSTASFSPFTVVLSDEPAPAPEDTDTPKATVTEINNPENITYDWLLAGQNWNGLNLVEADTKLNAAYTFQAPHTAETVKDSQYAGWYCDYFVSVSQPVSEGGIILGGQYTQWSDGWVGFYSPADVDANVAVPLLSLVGNPWTYEDVVRDVATFNCGVADVDGALAAAGVVFTVQLRLVDPTKVNIYNENWWENIPESAYVVVNTVTYNFATGASTIN